MTKDSTSTVGAAEQRRTSAADRGVLGRREWLALSAACGSAFLQRQGLAVEEGGREETARPAEDPPRRQFGMKKSINLWAFPYPDRMNLEQCFRLARDAGFDAVEVNFNLEGELSAESSPAELEAIGQLARDRGVAVSGLCSFLYWPYSLTHSDPQRRTKGLELAHAMIDAARHLGTDNLLVVPGATYVPWLEGEEPVPNDVCDRRAKEAIRQLIPHAERAGVYLNIENIFANGYLFSPEEIVAFVDGFASPQVQVHFDTGNVMQYQFPEHWIPLLGKRIRNVHFKEWDKRTKEFTLHTFRTLLDGTTNWPAVLDALDRVGYRGYLTFEYFHPFNHYPEALIFQTSDALDRMLGRIG